MLHFREWKLRDGKSEDEEDEGDKRAKRRGERREIVAVEKKDEEVRNEREVVKGGFRRRDNEVFFEI